MYIRLCSLQNEHRTNISIQGCVISYREIHLKLCAQLVQAITTSRTKKITTKIWTFSLRKSQKKILLANGVTEARLG